MFLFGLQFGRNFVTILQVLFCIVGASFLRGILLSFVSLIFCLFLYSFIYLNESHVLRLCQKNRRPLDNIKKVEKNTQDPKLKLQKVNYLP